MMKMLSISRSPKANGSPPCLHKSWSNAPAPPPPTPSATCVWISVTMASSAQCTPAQPVKRLCWATQHIIVWKPNVVSVFDGDTLMTSAIFRFVEDAIPQDMWSMTAQSTHLPNHSLTALMGELTQMMTISTPLWMTTREVRYIKPGAQVYEGGNVTIFFLSHVFFLITIV